jgi:ribonuclease E
MREIADKTKPAGGDAKAPVPEKPATEKPATEKPEAAKVVSAAPAQPTAPEPAAVDGADDGATDAPETVLPPSPDDPGVPEDASGERESELPSFLTREGASDRRRA